MDNDRGSCNECCPICSPRCSLSCGPTYVAGFDALLSIIGVAAMIKGLITVPSASTDNHVLMARKLMIGEVALLTLQVMLSFLLYCAVLKNLRDQTTRPGKTVYAWIISTVMLLVLQAIIIVTDATLGGAVGIFYIGIGFVVSFVIKVWQIFNILQYVYQRGPDHERLQTEEN